MNEMNVDNAPENFESDESDLEDKSELEDDWDYEDEEDVIAELDAAIQVNDRHRDRRDFELLMRNLRNVLNTRRYHGNSDLIKKLIVCTYGTGDRNNRLWCTDFVKEFWDDFCPKEFARLKRQVSSEKQRAPGTSMTNSYTW